MCFALSCKKKKVTLLQDISASQDRDAAFLKEPRYVFTGETKTYDGVLLRRIRYTRAGLGGTQAGTLGGWIESVHNLPLSDEAVVLDSAMVYGAAVVFKKAIVSGHVVIKDRSLVYDEARIKDSVVLSEQACVYHKAEVSGRVQIKGYSKVYGAAKVTDSVFVEGVMPVGVRIGDQVRVYGGAKILGESLVAGRAQVYGLSEIRDKAKVYGSAQVFASAQVRGEGSVFDAAQVYGAAVVYSGDHFYLARLEKGKRLQEQLFDADNISWGAPNGSYVNSSKSRTYRLVGMVYGRAKVAATARIAGRVYDNADLSSAYNCTVYGSVYENAVIDLIAIELSGKGGVEIQAGASIYGTAQILGNRVFVATGVRVYGTARLYNKGMSYTDLSSLFFPDGTNIVEQDISFGISGSAGKRD